MQGYPESWLSCASAGFTTGPYAICAVVGPSRQVACNGGPALSQVTTVPESLAGGNVSSICIGDVFACPVSNGRVVCWGDSTYDQTSVPGDLTYAVSVDCGRCMACALTATRKVRCWGQYDTRLGPREPFNVLPSDASESVGQLSVGANHVCVTVAAPGSYGTGGILHCAGYYVGSPPLGAYVDRVTAAGHATCTMTSGLVSCFIDNAELANVPPAAMVDVTSIAGGEGLAMAVKQDGSVVS